MEIQEVFGNSVNYSGRSAQEEMLLQGQAMLQTKTEYHTAVTVIKSRNLALIQDKLIREAELAGEAFFYSWTVNGKNGKKITVEGKSYQLQKAAATYYSNCVVNCRVDKIDDHFIYLTGEFIDLENGTTHSRPFVQRKDVTKGGGGYDDARRLEMAIGIGISKAKRNVINDAMPGWLTDEAFEAAKAASLKKVSGDVDAAREKAIKAFYERYRVTQEQLEEKIGNPSSRWTPRNIMELRSAFQALLNGEASLEDIFPNMNQSKETQQQPKSEMKVESATVQGKPQEKPVEEPKKRGRKPQPEPQETPEQPAAVEEAVFAFPDVLPGTVTDVLNLIRAIPDQQTLNQFKQKFGNDIQNNELFTVFETSDFLSEIDKREKSFLRK